MSSIDLVPLTKEGYENLQTELANLKTIERPAVIAAIAEARGHGDLKENAEYHAAREKQGFIEARIADLDDKLSRAEIIDNARSGAKNVRFGAWVVLSDEESGEEKKYRIVGDLEADIQNNRLSVSSPMAKALLGKHEDDLVRIVVPKGTREYVILSVKY